MGETLSREFSMKPVDTGQSTPPTQVPLNSEQLGLPPGAQMQVPGTPVSRPSFLQAFLANLGPALAGGMSASGPQGEQNFGSGLAGGFAGVQNYQQKQFERAQQIQQAQRQARNEQSEAALRSAQTDQLKQLTPLEVQQRQMEIQARKGIIDLANAPGGVDQVLSPMSQALGDTSPEEKTILDSAKGQVVSNLRQGKFDVAPYQEAATKIAQDRIGRKGKQTVDEQELAAYKTNPNVDKGTPLKGRDAATFAVWKAKQAPLAQLAIQTPAGGWDPETVGAIANGSLKLNDVITARTPATVRQNLIKQVQAVNPQFSSANYEIAKKETEAFTSGAQGQQLTAINTARNHMETFKKLATALGNGDSQLLNEVGLKFKEQFGSAAPTNFAIAKEAFAGEVGKAFAGANVGVADRAALDEKIKRASSPQQLLEAANTADELLAGKQKALKQSYEQGRQGKPNFGGTGSGAASAPEATHIFVPGKGLVAK